MPTQKVSAGQWIRVPILDAYPVRMRIGDGENQFAFIDHEIARGTVVTFAQRRCPAGLRPGSYNVTVSSGVETKQFTIQVV